MSKFLIRRLAQVLPMLVGVSIISFSIMHLAPGDPVQLLTSRTASTEEIARVRQLYGLDAPVHVQYWRWLSRVAAGDLGRSFVSGRPVLELISERLPATLLLGSVSEILIFAIAVPIGVAAAVRQYSRFDYTVTAASFFGLAMPNFWLAMILIYVLAIPLTAIPTSGMMTYGLTIDQAGLLPVLFDRARHLLLPVTVLVTGGVAAISRYMRSGMLDVLREDYVRTARAKGLRERTVLYRHTLRNALLPVITLMGFELSVLLGGTVIVESIFSWPGLGMAAYQAIQQRDYQVVMAFNMMGAALLMTGMFAADVMYALVDPRIRYR
ncbi:MAG: ABC transporter permease [Thermaerobacterales bacterium]